MTMRAGRLVLLLNDKKLLLISLRLIPKIAMHAKVFAHKKIMHSASLTHQSPQAQVHLGEALDASSQPPHT